MAVGWLVVECETGAARFLLDGREQTLGRSGDNDIVVTQPFVSRHHARITWRVGLPVVVDQGSTHGLSVQGARRDECLLSPGQIVEIRGPRPGDVVRLRFEADGTAEITGAASKHLLGGPPTGLLQPRAAQRRLTIGRAAENDVILDHPQVSRRHAVIELQSGGATVVDHSANGTFVNGKRLAAKQELKAGDRIRICCFELEWDGRQLVQYDQTRRARLDALHLSRVVGNGACILNDVTLTALPRELIAIVGTSGAGKSTLMDALNGVRPATSGAVLVNGRDYYREFAAMRLIVGYVPQSDVVHRDLPTERALGYSAALRLPPDTTVVERAARVSAVLSEVGLDDRRTVPVGRLSGGQIKRVSIGVELLTRPSLFFLDEPTSGLDPGYEKRVMELLRGLADEGRTILLITHATQSIELCDHVAVMAPGGYLAFFGPPRKCATRCRAVSSLVWVGGGAAARDGRRWGDRP